MNGTQRIANQPFAATAGYANYATVRILLPLVAGKNKVTLAFSSSKGSKSNLNVDQLKLVAAQ